MGEWNRDKPAKGGGGGFNATFHQEKIPYKKFELTKAPQKRFHPMSPMPSQHRLTDGWPVKTPLSDFQLYHIEAHLYCEILSCFCSLNKNRKPLVYLSNLLFQ